MASFSKHPKPSPPARALKAPSIPSLRSPGPGIQLGTAHGFSAPSGALPHWLTRASTMTPRPLAAGGSRTPRPARFSGVPGAASAAGLPDSMQVTQGLEGLASITLGGGQDPSLPVTRQEVVAPNSEPDNAFVTSVRDPSAAQEPAGQIFEHLAGAAGEPPEFPFQGRVSAAPPPGGGTPQVPPSHAQPFAARQSTTSNRVPGSFTQAREPRLAAVPPQAGQEFGTIAVSDGPRLTPESGDAAHAGKHEAPTQVAGSFLAARTHPPSTAAVARFIERDVLRPSRERPWATSFRGAQTDVRTPNPPRHDTRRFPESRDLKPAGSGGTPLPGSRPGRGGSASPRSGRPHLGFMGSAVDQYVELRGAELETANAYWTASRRLDAATKVAFEARARYVVAANELVDLGPAARSAMRRVLSSLFGGDKADLLQSLKELREIRSQQEKYRKLIEELLPKVHEADEAHLDAASEAAEKKHALDQLRAELDERLNEVKDLPNGEDLADEAWDRYELDTRRNLGRQTNPGLDSVRRERADRRHYRESAAVRRRGEREEAQIEQALHGGRINPAEARDQRRALDARMAASDREIVSRAWDQRADQQRLQDREDANALAKPGDPTDPLSAHDRRLLRDLKNGAARREAELRDARLRNARRRGARRDRWAATDREYDQRLEAVDTDPSGTNDFHRWADAQDARERAEEIPRMRELEEIRDKGDRELTDNEKEELKELRQRENERRRRAEARKCLNCTCIDCPPDQCYCVPTAPPGEDSDGDSDDSQEEEGQTAAAEADEGGSDEGDTEGDGGDEDKDKGEGAGKERDSGVPKSKGRAGPKIDKSGRASAPAQQPPATPPTPGPVPPPVGRRRAEGGAADPIRQPGGGADHGGIGPSPDGAAPEVNGRDHRVPADDMQTPAPTPPAAPVVPEGERTRATQEGDRDRRPSGRPTVTPGAKVDPRPSVEQVVHARGYATQFVRDLGVMFDLGGGPLAGGQQPGPLQAEAPGDPVEIKPPGAVAEALKARDSVLELLTSMQARLWIAFRQLTRAAEDGGITFDDEGKVKVEEWLGKSKLAWAVEEFRRTGTISAKSINEHTHTMDATSQSGWKAELFMFAVRFFGVSGSSQPGAYERIRDSLERIRGGLEAATPDALVSRLNTLLSGRTLLELRVELRATELATVNLFALSQLHDRWSNHLGLWPEVHAELAFRAVLARRTLERARHSSERDLLAQFNGLGRWLDRSAHILARMSRHLKEGDDRIDIESDERFARQTWPVALFVPSFRAGGLRRLGRAGIRGLGLGLRAARGLARGSHRLAEITAAQLKYVGGPGLKGVLQGVPQRVKRALWRLPHSAREAIRRYLRGTQPSKPSFPAERTGPIPRSVGAMSRAEAVARRYRLNIKSPTTRQVLHSLDDPVEDFIAQYRIGRIWREMPGEVRGLTVEEALGVSKKVRKLLIDGRFAK